MRLGRLGRSGLQGSRPREAACRSRMEARRRRVGRGAERAECRRRRAQARRQACCPRHRHACQFGDRGGGAGRSDAAGGPGRARRRRRQPGLRLDPLRHPHQGSGASPQARAGRRCCRPRRRPRHARGPGRTRSDAVRRRAAPLEPIGYRHRRFGKGVGVRSHQLPRPQGHAARWRPDPRPRRHRRRRWRRYFEGLLPGARRRFGARHLRHRRRAGAEGDRVVCAGRVRVPR